MPSELDFTPANILGYAREYSFYAPDAAQGYKTANGTTLTGTFAGFRHTVVDQRHRIAVINCVKNMDPMSNRGAAFIINPSLKDTASGTFSYFLPWDQRGAAVELSIPQFTVGDDFYTNPPIFFTAVLSGCSIFFKGSADKPTIFHCGTAGGGVGQATQGNSNQYFRSMLKQIKRDGLGRAKKKIQTQVLSSDYMEPKSGLGAATLHKTAFKDMIASHYENQFIIQHVSMWGCVFGFRVGTRWEFYLQENASITYHRSEDVLEHFIPIAIARGSNSFQLSDLTENDIENLPLGKKTIMRARPVVVSQVFPGGVPMGPITSRWKSLRV